MTSLPKLLLIGKFFLWRGGLYDYVQNSIGAPDIKVTELNTRKI